MSDRDQRLIAAGTFVFASMGCMVAGAFCFGVHAGGGALILVALLFAIMAMSARR